MSLQYDAYLKEHINSVYSGYLWILSHIRNDLYEIFNWWNDHMDRIKLGKETYEKVLAIFRVILDKINEIGGEVVDECVIFIAKICTRVFFGFIFVINMFDFLKRRQKESMSSDLYFEKQLWIIISLLAIAGTLGNL